MTKVASVAAIKAAEKGKDEDALIKRAATALAEAVMARSPKSVTVVVGGGNNGCDGLECAKILADKTAVTIVLIGESKNAGNAKRRAEVQHLPHAVAVEKCDVVLDCVFGNGYKQAPFGEYAHAINMINKSAAYVISADVPSGLYADDGKCIVLAVKADETVAFSAISRGLLIGRGRNYSGKITVADLGLTVDADGELVSESAAKLPARQPVSHKGDYGKVKIIGGSAEMPGAPLMCFESALAASRAGAGLVTLCVPKSEKAAYSSRVKETMLCLLPEKNGALAFDLDPLDKAIDGADAVVFGCGVGRGEDVEKFVRHLASSFSGTLILDADALYAVATHNIDLCAAKGKIILTPHLGEFERLCGTDGNLVESAKTYAKRQNVVLAVKSATTIITDGERVFYNTSGSPALAKGGSGDVLAGVIAAFSCVLSPLEATVAACWHFGKAGESAAKRLNSVTSVLASDIIIDLSLAP